MRASRVAARREPRRELPEDVVGLLVFVVDDVEGGEVVERVLGPRAVGELVDERPRQRDVLVAAAERAAWSSGRSTAPRHGGTPDRGTARDRRGPAVPAQEVVALGDAELHELRRRRRRPTAASALEGLAGRSVAAIGEQALGARQLAREAGRARRPSGAERRDAASRPRPTPRPRSSASRSRSSGRPSSARGAIARLRRRPRQAQQHVVGRGRLQREHLVVERDRGGVVALASC